MRTRFTSSFVNFKFLGHVNKGLIEGISYMRTGNTDNIIISLNLKFININVGDLELKTNIRLKVPQGEEGTFNGFIFLDREELL